VGNVISFLAFMVAFYRKVRGKIKENNQVIKEQFQRTLKKVERKGGLSGYIWWVVGVVVAFFESLPLFVAVWVIGLLVLAIIGVVMVIFLIWVALKGVEDKKDLDITDDSGCVENVFSGDVQFTMDEFAKISPLLTDYEKNIYKVGLLAREAVNGFGTGSIINDDRIPEEARYLMVLGKASTETSMRFYKNNKNYDIFKIPSDIGANSSSYGMYGIHVSKKLENYWGSKASIIKSKYKPASTPPYDASYAPHGIAMSAKHFSGNINEVSKYWSDKIDKVADMWGIKENRKEFYAYATLFLGQVRYHTGNRYDRYIKNEVEGYLHFYAALFHATADKDSERSFSKWSIDLNSSYDESSFRKTMMGKQISGSRFLTSISSPDDLSLPSNHVKIYLNGNQLKVPVWKYLWDKYKGNANFKHAWDVAKAFSRVDTDRTLNFHYGFNSFLQTQKIKANILVKRGGKNEKVVVNKCSKLDQNVGVDLDSNTDLGIKVARNGEKYIGISYALATPPVKIIKPGRYDIVNNKNINGEFLGTLDCSYFVQTNFKDFGVKLPRTSREQAKDTSWGKTVTTTFDLSKLKPGDVLIFWGTYGSYNTVFNSYKNPSSAPYSVKLKNVSHVGIYWGNGKMIHTSTTEKPLRVEDIKSYWISHFVEARRPNILLKGGE